MNSNVKFHHFGLAVKTFDKALKFYENLNYDCSKRVIDHIQNVELILCTSRDFPSVELIKPINNLSPIMNYLKNNNQMIYHTCYEIDNNIEIKKLFAKNRVICISKPQPAVLFNDRLVSFYYLPDVGVIEILHNE